MNTKAQELELRNIMQGLEEFATFMSYRGNNAGLRILSVESVAQAEQTNAIQRSGQIIKMPLTSTRNAPHKRQALNKALSFQDRELH